MPTFQLSIDAYIFTLIIGIAVLAGFWGRSRQLAKKDRRICQLEQELESRVASDTSPVITMKSNKNEEPPPQSTDRRTSVRKDRPTGTD